jgi:hypothetical protein
MTDSSQERDRSDNSNAEPKLVFLLFEPFNNALNVSENFA